MRVAGGSCWRRYGFGGPVVPAGAASPPPGLDAGVLRPCRPTTGRRKDVVCLASFAAGDCFRAVAQPCARRILPTKVMLCVIRRHDSDAASQEYRAAPARRLARPRCQAKLAATESSRPLQPDRRMFTSTLSPHSCPVGYDLSGSRCPFASG